MKIRGSFVTNSSSSSFVIDKFYLSPFQIKAIHDRIKYADELGLYEDEWEIYEGELVVKGRTHMDNFDMRVFLKFLHVNPDWITWGGYEYWEKP